MSAKVSDDNDRPRKVWDLCEQVCDAIEASPTNYYQGAWARPVGHIIHRILAQEYSTPEAKTEACGTAFCRAGWMVAIVDQMNGPEMVKRNLASHHVFVMERATSILRKAKIPDSEIRRLFSSDDAGSICESFLWGSKEYAAAGVRGMRRLMESYETQLKETLLDDE